MMFFTLSLDISNFIVPNCSKLLYQRFFGIIASNAYAAADSALVSHNNKYTFLASGKLSFVNDVALF